MWCSFMGSFPTVFNVVQCIESRIEAFQTGYQWYHGVNVTSLCVRMILLVENYTPLTVYGIPQIEGAREIVMQDPWTLLVTPPVQT